MKKIIKTIIVPTDFSPSADCAVSYAFNLADLIKAKIILYHSFIPLESGFYPVAQSTKENLETEKNIFNRLINIKKIFSKTHKKVQVATIVNRGPEKQKILEFCKNKKVDMIVMGTKGASGLKKVLLGSFTSSLLLNAPCPVLAIPLNSKFEIPKRITFATNYHNNDIFTIKFLLNLNAYFGAKLNILHVDNIKDSHNLKNIKFDEYKKMINKKFKNVDLSFKHVESMNTLQALLQFTVKDKTDLFAISPIIKDSLFSRLFHKSIIKAIANKIHLPLISIPTK